ncbi:hypothetical protein LBMAG48_16420 [Phycisphaerae bacterium]|jgi:hypothetical protein|nr:hypothetical protein LBMAG48_16420 [Phycisphaerae bacterium]
MATTPNSKSGQRTNTTSASGKKERSPTSKGQSGSRVEPSHTAAQNKAAKNKSK